MSFLIMAVARLLELALDAYLLIIIARAVISWVSPDPYNPIVRFLYRATEPVLRPIRHRLPDMRGLDISPLVALIAIQLAQWLVVGSLREFAVSIR